MRALRPGGESRTFVLFASVIILVLVGSVLVLRPGSPESAIDPDAGSQDESSAVPTPPEPSASPTGTAAAGGTTEAADLFGGHTGNLGVPPGMQGNGDYTQLPKHTLTVRVSTALDAARTFWRSASAGGGGEGKMIRGREVR